MIYRNYIPEDKDQVKALCDQHGIDLPERSMLFVAEDDNGKIAGFSGIRGEIFLEPLISNNPIAAVKLFEKTIKHFRDSGVNRVRCICKPERKELFEKVGFRQIEEDKILMEKEV